MSTPVTRQSDTKSLHELFRNWDAAALEDTIDTAKRYLTLHGMSFPKALEAIGPLAGGNVSLSCRAHYRPIEDVLRAMERGYA